ncbi:hypothetical protein AC579_5475 [Pseudocercospora musae]|uniref:Uncharacterized protein n=1 Tax=Pseudocercospora musae TaxID=113226 RepID=A0A139IQ00_9PEZI|nr:hypothetical protein AC579_5475 [Pseudocercospora musae]
MDTSDPLFVLRKACEELDRRDVTHVSELSYKKTTDIKIELEDQDYDDGYPTPRDSPCRYYDEAAAKEQSLPNRKYTPLPHRERTSDAAYDNPGLSPRTERQKQRRSEKAIADAQGITWRGKRPAVIAYTEQNDEFILEAMNRFAMSSGGQMIPMETLAAQYNEGFPGEDGRSIRGLDSHIRRTTRLAEARGRLCNREG